MAVRVFVPVVVKTTLQLPVPLVSVTLQFVFAPVILTTVPLGIANPLATVTVTATFWFVVDGSGIWAVMVVAVEYLTAWVVVTLFVACVLSPL